MMSNASLGTALTFLRVLSNGAGLHRTGIIYVVYQTRFHLSDTLQGQK